MNAFEVGVFNELATYKKKLIDDGKEIIDLSIGSPDLPPPSFIIEELLQQVKNTSNYGYSLSGIDLFKQAVCTYYENKYLTNVNSDNEVLLLMGSQDGLVHLPMVLADPGDIILVPDPGYTAYMTGISMADAKPYPMPLVPENGYLPNLSEIPPDVASEAKMMILNYPGNPVPAMATYEFFEEVIQFAKRYNIIVVHDFAYSELYYTNEKPISFLSVPGAKEVGVEFNSLSKSFNMAGCRVGYLVGNHQVLAALNSLKTNLDYGIFMPIQYAAIAALLDESSFSHGLREKYKKRRDLLVQGLNQIGWKVEEPKASMFVWAKVPATYTSTTFTYELMEKAGVVVTPGNAFGLNGEGFVRMALVKEEEVLKNVITNLKQSGLFKIVQ